MGGGFFDNVWDPYNGAYAYPRAQFYRPRAPVSDPYESSRVPEVGRSPSKVEEPLSKKTVRTIPVTDGLAPAAVPQQVSQAEMVPVVVKLESEDAASTTIQAMYRGYLVRKTKPLKHLRVIKKVKEDLANFKRKLQEEEQERKLRSDSQERLRWTEGVMALLLRLDTLQGVHPNVRLIRKAVTKELIQFQEKIDSMSTMPGGLNGRDDGNIGEDISISDVAKEEAGEIDIGSDVLTTKGVDEDFIGQGVEATKDLTSDEHAPQVHSDMHDQTIDSHASNFLDGRAPLAESIVEEVGLVSEPISSEADAEVSMDVEKTKQILTRVPATEEVEVKPGISQFEPPPTDSEINNNEALGVEDSTATKPSGNVFLEPMSEDDASVAPARENNVEEMWDQACHMGRREEADWLAEEASRLVSDTSHNSVNGVLGGNSKASTIPLEEKETTSRFTNQGDGGMIPAGCTRSTCLEPQCINSLQVCQPSTADDINGLSDRALLLQLLKENRKLKDVVGKLLHLGKHQNDVMHNLTARIKQLEEHHPQLNLLEDEEIKGRKKESDDAVGDRRRSLQRSEQGRRKEKSGSRPELDIYIDSEDWSSAESDGYF